MVFFSLMLLSYMNGRIWVVLRIHRLISHRISESLPVCISERIEADSPIAFQISPIY
jgi:hypothetical protein